MKKLILALASAFMLLTSLACAAPISTYPPATTPLTGSEQMISTQAGTTVNITPAMIGSYSAAVPTGSAGQTLTSKGGSLSPSYLTTTVNAQAFYPNTVTPGAGNEAVDESSYIQAAATYVCGLGGGAVTLPPTSAYYVIHQAIKGCYGLTIQGVTGGPATSVENLSTTGQTVGLQGTLFLFGNVHNAYLENIANFPSSGSVYYATNAITAGATSVTLTSLGDHTHFAVGDQVYVASTTYTTVGGFGLADYGWLDRITAINTGSGVISLAYPIDTALSSGLIVDLPANLARQSIPLFFCEHCALKNLNITSSQSTNWMSDSACLDCRFENLTTNAPCGPYGNMMQYTWWVDNTYNFSSCMGQWGANSLNSFDINGKYNFVAQSGVTASGGWTFNERSRGIQLVNPQVNLGSFAPGSGSPVFFLIDTQHARILNPQVQGAGYATSAIFIGSAGTSTFNIYDDVVDGGVINLATLSRWIDIDNGSVVYTHDNGVRNIELLGTPTAAATAIWFNNSSINNFFDNSRTGVGSGGQITFAGTFSNNHIHDDYIDGGWGTNLLTQVTPNDVRGMTSAAWLAKLAAVNSITGLVNPTPNTSTIIYDTGAIGAAFDPNDVLTVDLSFITPTSSGDSVNFEVYNSAGPIENVFLTSTLSSATWYSWLGTLRFVTGSSYVLYNQAGTAYQQSYTPSSTLHIRIKATSVNAMDNFIIGAQHISLSNPMFP